MNMYYAIEDKDNIQKNDTLPLEDVDSVTDSNDEDDNKLSEMIVVKALDCPMLPGKFVLKCYRRHIFFTWNPPTEHVERSMIKFRELHQSKFKTMTDYGWGSSKTGSRNLTIGPLFPNTIYEFGANFIYKNGTFKSYPFANSSETCACQTESDVPEMSTNLRYHYLQDNQYSLEWIPGKDNGQPITNYTLKSIPMKPKPDKLSKWQTITPYNISNTQANFTINSTQQLALQLRAVNKVGNGKSSYIVIQPPNKKIPGRSHSSFFEPFSHMSGIVTYSLLSVIVLLLFLFLIAFFAYRRRQKEVKSNKHSFFINFNPTKRFHPTSGNGSSILGLGSDLTTSGLAFDLTNMEPLWNQEVNSLYGLVKSDLNTFEQVTQIPAANVRFLRYIGCGAFGKVWEGWLHVHDTEGDRFEKVALKVRNCKSLTEDEFKREATLMHKYQHKNIVKFYGVSFDTPSQQFLVLEMMEEGNLRDYLHRSRPRIAPEVAANVFATSAAAAVISAAGNETREAGSLSEGLSMNTSTTSTAVGGTPTASNVIALTAQLDLPALVGIMRDVSYGCRYLEEQHFVHRDIAARNCLVSHNHPNGRIVKLCDFGLARDIYKNDYYRKRNEPKLPVRWMSPEAIRDGLFTTKSDVWAFAVTCWEILTLGADPFYGRANVDVMNLVIGGHVLGRPENCPEELYNQLLQCWSRFTEMRPSFAQLSKKMDEFVLSSHNSQSPFSSPFVVSLPMPKNLPNVSGQRISAYNFNKTHHESNNLSLCMLSTSCQHGTSLEERTNLSDMDTSLNEANNSSKQHLLSGNQQKDVKFTSIQSKNNYHSTHVRGYTVTPGIEDIEVNKFNCKQKCLLQNHVSVSSTAPLTGGYEYTPSDPSTEQTTVAATSNGTDSNRPHSMKSNRAISVTTTSNSNHSNKNQKLMKIKTQPQLKHRHTINYQHNPLNTIAYDTNSITYNPRLHNEGIALIDSMRNPGLTAHWLMETGGGVDSLGYEKPTVIRASAIQRSITNPHTMKQQMNKMLMTMLTENPGTDIMKQGQTHQTTINNNKIVPN